MKELSSGVIASVRQRLLNHARTRGEDFQFTLVRYGIERFLYRLSRSPYADRYVVKGATLFTVWLHEPHRPTRDLDLTAAKLETQEELEANLRLIFEQECSEDGLVLDPSTLSFEPIQGQAYPGLRCKFIAFLGNAKIYMQLDVGFGDTIFPQPQVSEYPCLLALPAPQVRLYPQETFIAEKFETMVSLGLQNSRLKDFSDIAYLASTAAFDGTKLSQAVLWTFQHRSTPIDPADRPGVLRPAFYQDPAKNRQWEALATENPPIERLGSFPQVGELLSRFLEPLWSAVANKRGWEFVWDPEGNGLWREAGDAAH